MFKKGFTVIEVALVLAIAGLIFLMVFITLPSLRVAQKDSTRRDDVSRLVTAISNYATNSRGSLNNLNATDLEKYLGNDFVDPDGEAYILDIKKMTSRDSNLTTDSRPTMYIRTSALCDGESIKYDNNNRNFAVIYRLEGAGSYCMDNQL